MFQFFALTGRFSSKIAMLKYLEFIIYVQVYEKLRIIIHFEIIILT